MSMGLSPRETVCWAALPSIVANMLAPVLRAMSAKPGVANPPNPNYVLLSDRRPFVQGRSLEGL